MSAKQSKQRNTASGRRKTAARLGGARLLPAHAQIEQHLRSLILAGGGRTEPLPTEKALAASFKVNRMTVRQAYQRLAGAGLVSRRRGIGTFVNPPVVESLPIAGKDSLEAWLYDRNTTARQVLKFKLLPCPLEIAALFNVKPDTRVTYLERLRIIKGVRYFDVRYMRPEIFKKISPKQIEHGSLLLLLLDAGFNAASVRVEIDAHLASPLDAANLSISVGDPVLERRIIYSDRAGTVLFYGRTKCPGQRAAYSFSTEITSELKTLLTNV